MGSIRSRLGGFQTKPPIQATPVVFLVYMAAALHRRPSGPTPLAFVLLKYALLSDVRPRIPWPRPLGPLSLASLVPPAGSTEHPEPTPGPLLSGPLPQGWVFDIQRQFPWS